MNTTRVDRERQRLTRVHHRLEAERWAAHLAHVLEVHPCPISPEPATGLDHLLAGLGWVTPRKEANLAYLARLEAHHAAVSVAYSRFLLHRARERRGAAVLCDRDASLLLGSLHESWQNSDGTLRVINNAIDSDLAAVLLVDFVIGFSRNPDQVLAAATDLVQLAPSKGAEEDA